MKRILLVIALAAAVLPLRAQDDLTRYIRMNLSGDYKYISYPDGPSPSVGYAASLEYVDGHLLVGAGFDNGVRSSSMEQYSTLLSARTGYVFRKGRFQLTPFIKAGWFMDVRKIENSCSLAGYHQFLFGGGLEGTWPATSLIWITASAQFVSSSLAGNGCSFTFGIMIPLYDFNERKND